MPIFIRFCCSFPCHFCTWTTFSSLLLFSRSLFSPLTSIHAQSFAWCLLFSCFGLHRFHAVPCLVFIHLHPNTNRQYLYPSYGIGLSFSLLFRFDILFLFHLSLTFSQTGFRFFKTSIIKTAKTLYTFFCASFAPGPLLNLSPLPLHLQTYRINQPPFLQLRFVLFYPSPTRFTSFHAPRLCRLTFSVVMQFCVT